ncbi:hypothetical protein, partial [Myroides odoratus]|uniref:hypothetical protein n=1 Tax=Myroides odoratus TaxID=256 RepID=UPI0033408F6B
FEKSVSSIGAHGHVPVRGKDIFCFLIISLYIGKRFLPFRKGHFCGMNQIKEEYLLKKVFRA